MTELDYAIKGMRWIKSHFPKDIGRDGHTEVVAIDRQMEVSAPISSLRLLRSAIRPVFSMAQKAQVSFEEVEQADFFYHIPAACSVCGMNDKADVGYVAPCHDFGQAQTICIGRLL